MRTMLVQIEQEVGLDSLPNEEPDSIVRSGRIPLSYWEEEPHDRFGEELFGYLEDDDDDDDDEGHEFRQNLSRFGVSYSPSGFRRASYSGESSVARETRSRLYERWAMMSPDANYRESQDSRRSSSSKTKTLGEMLSLPQVKKKVTEAKGKRGEERKNSSPELRNERGHKRSKPLPTSSALSESNRGALRETKSVGSSLRHVITGLFFSKKKKRISKDKAALRSCKKDEFKNVPRDSSSCLQEHSCIGSLATVIGKQHMGFLQEVRLIPKKLSTPQNSGENQDHQSPISVLDEQFEEDEDGLLTPKVFTQYEPVNRHASSCPAEETSTMEGSEGDEHDWIILFVRTLLLTVLQGSTFFSRWHSLESPLNPSLRDKDIIFTDKETPHEEAKRRQQKLVFDLVNELLLDIGHETYLNHTRIGPKKGNFIKNISSSTVLEEAMSQVTAWLRGETGFFSDENTLTGKDRSDESSLEMGNLGKDMEKILLDELVLETLFELIGRV